jgi:hypothetical protein
MGLRSSSLTQEHAIGYSPAQLASSGAKNLNIKGLIASAGLNFRSKLRGYEKISMRIFSKVVIPECFNRGSSQNFAWIPAKNMRE